MMQQLLDEILKDSSISSSLKYTRKDNAILCVRWQDLMSLVTVQASNLYWRHSQGGPASPPEPNPVVTSRLVNVNQVV